MIGKRILSLVLCLLMVTVVFVAVPANVSAENNGDVEIEWVRQFGGLGPSEEYASAVDIDGNIYIAGGTGGTLPDQTTSGSSDGFVRKYDINGNELWTQQFGTSSIESCVDISLDSTGVYIAGHTRGTFPGETNAGYYDVFVRKYDFDSNEIWTHQFGSSSYDYARGISVDSTGLYIVGTTRGTIPGQTKVGYWDAFIRKYDINGNEKWTHQFGTSGRDSASGITAYMTGIYIVGHTKGIFQGQTGLGGYDAFICKYDINGNELWTRQFGTSMDDYTEEISVDSSGVYIAGWKEKPFFRYAFVFKYDLNGNEVWSDDFTAYNGVRAYGISVDSSGVYAAGETYGALPGQTKVGHPDAFVRKYDADGNEVWTRQFGSSYDWHLYPGHCHAYGIATDSTNVFVVGDAGGDLPGQTGSKRYDVFIRKYDIDGTEQWTDQFSGLMPVHDYSNAVDFNGNIYVVGITYGALPGQTSATKTWESSSDVFVRKYDADGNEVWTRQFGTLASDQGTSIYLDSSGVYVAGHVSRALPGQTYNGWVDAFIRKYDFDGNEIWTTQFGTTDCDQILGISGDSSGVYLAGRVVFEDEIGDADEDSLVCKLSLDGTIIWTDRFGTSTQEYYTKDRAKAISVDTSGVYVVGETDGTFQGQNNAGGLDVYIRKYNHDGDVIWTHQFGTPSLDSACGIILDSTGLYIAGRTDGAFQGETNAGGSDAFVRKYDFDSTEIWTRQFGTSNHDLTTGISVDTSGVYLSGDTNGAFADHTNAGNYDVFTRKYDINGNHAWTYQFGTSNEDRSTGISIGEPGDVYVNGWTAGEFPDQDGMGGRDAFVAKLTFLTPTGPNIEVEPIQGVSMTFSEITETGVTTATIYEENPGPAKAGFKFLDIYYDISTTATYTGDITISISYDDSNVPGGKENTLKLFHWDGTNWIDLTTSLDTENNIVYGTVSSLSWFTIGYEVLYVQIDIKPGSDPNSINLGSQGNVPVAILSSSDFDATSVDPTSVILAGASVGLKGKSSKYMASEDDVDNNGLLDLMVHVDINEIDLIEGSTEAVLECITTDGKIIQGIDSINIVPP